MTGSTLHTGEEPDLTAAEYVLGVLDTVERVQAEARLERDPAFSREVTWWEAQLAPLADGVAPVEPSAALWDKIAILIGQPGKAGLLGSVALWRGLTAASLVAAAACLVVLVNRPQPVIPPVVAPAAPPETVVATIMAPDGKTPSLVATLDRASQKLIMTPVNLKVGDKRSAELWVIPEGQSPKSLGVIPTGGSAKMDLPADLTGSGLTTAKLAVTDEPLGGSPTGGPTGRIIAVGGFSLGTK